MRLLLDAMLYVLRTGCAWRHLPRDVPPRQTVLRWFLRLARSGVSERMAHALAMAVANATPIIVELVSPKPDQRGFAVQPRRWVIERTFGWVGRCRRLARDHEATPNSAIAFFVLAAANILLRRMAKAI